jgi:protein-S-isoprenylcysteine O-methyltransferase Ste14
MFQHYLGMGSNSYRVMYNIIAFVYLLGLLVLHLRLHSPYIYDPTALSHIIALLLVLPGAAIMILCIAKYFKQLSGAFREKNQSHLYTGGLHQFVRHPLYFGTFLFLIGLALYWPLFKNILVVAIIILYTLVGIIFEEKKLLRQFGEAYKNYQQQVPMIIPRLRIRNKKTILGN